MGKRLALLAIRLLVSVGVFGALQRKSKKAAHGAPSFWAKIPCWPLYC